MKLTCISFGVAMAAGSGCGFSSQRADEPGAGTACYGPEGWQICLDAPPTGQLALTGAFDADRSDAASPCLSTLPTSWVATQPDACIVTGDSVSLSSLTVTGKRPLIVVAHGQIALSGLVDVGSHRGGAIGPGAPSSACAAFVRSPGAGSGPTHIGSGGGAGGSFVTRGGNGGTGDDGNQQRGQSAEALVGTLAQLRGGCAGQPAGGGQASDGGAAGGAVYLVSGGLIDLGSATIAATGAGGAGGNSQRGGSGGGSGGMIVLYGASIHTTSKTLLLATGGGGGGGGGTGDSEIEGGGSAPPSVAARAVRGSDGFDPMAAIPVVAATGGSGGSQSDGKGGDGGDGFPAVSNAVDGRDGDSAAGGGGGGGAAGYIRANHELGAATVAPAAVIVE